MKKLINHIIALTLSTILLIGTSGFTVFHHTCQSSQLSELSLIVPDFSCEHYQHGKQETAPPCCSIHDEAEEHNSCDEGDCCNTESHQVKLEITLQVVNFDKKQDPISLMPAIQLETEAITSIPEEIATIIISNDLPPPLAGKDLLIFLHQLNIPFQSV